MLIFPDIDPVALQLGPLAIRWYALSYLVGILLGWTYIRWLDGKQTPPLLSKEQLDDMVVWGVLGIILGGRTGYVLFYNFPYFLDHPQEIFQVWHGGMAFHGGLLGIILAFYLFSRKNRLSFLSVMDRIAAAGPIGLFFGRLANFVNGELFGRVTDSPLGMVFPRGGDLPRHPSQLYEAALEGLVLFTLLFVLARYTSALKKPGIIGGLFLAGYGLARFTVEFFREPDAQLGFLAMGFSMGQWLSIPMILVGGLIALCATRRTHATA